jgi:hypothetical protein
MAIAYETAMASTQIIHAHLARTLLGWSPTKRGLIDGLERFYLAYLAAHAEEPEVATALDEHLKR